MNKALKTWLLASILFCCGCFIGCGNKSVEKTVAKTPNPEKITTEEKSEATYLTAVEEYLVNKIGMHYCSYDVCIPYPFIVNVDENNANDIRVWGDFWIFNYRLAGDTLKLESGGDHPGLMHVRKTNVGYEVFEFNAVEDGSRNMPSAQRIFGEYFDSFISINNDSEKRDELILKHTSEYVRQHQLSANYYQEFGRDAIKLP